MQNRSCVINSLLQLIRIRNSQDNYIRQQAITWANVDPDVCRQMVSLGLNELRIFCDRQ